MPTVAHYGPLSLAMPLLTLLAVAHHRFLSLAMPLPTMPLFTVPLPAMPLFSVPLLPMPFLPGPHTCHLSQTSHLTTFPLWLPGTHAGSCTGSQLIFQFLILVWGMKLLLCLVDRDTVLTNHVGLLHYVTPLRV